MNELVIKVSAPFVGIDDLGFTTRYPAQNLSEPLLDVPFILEGPAKPMSVLVHLLESFSEKQGNLKSEADDQAYSWTPPIQLADGLCILAFRDQSKHHPDQLVLAGPRLNRRYAWNLIRPIAHTFLQDCVRLADLCLTEQIDFRLQAEGADQIDLSFPLTTIVKANGTQLLYKF